MPYIGWQTCVCSTIYGVFIILEFIDQGIKVPFWKEVVEDRDAQLKFDGCN